MKDTQDQFHSDQIKTLFDSYKQSIDKLIEENIENLGNSSPLRDACEYSLKNGGKRFRPALVYLISTSLNPDVDVSMAALAIEYLHTASLIADDLPCMDNDDERRGKPSLHKVYDESIALMASYALIAAGYGCIAKNAVNLAKLDVCHAKNADEICRLALENVSHNSGLNGATGGQFLDIFQKDASLKNIEEVIFKKTVSLFEISFILGWLFGGGDIAKIDNVKKAAFHFGMAFQIADDIDDMQQDVINGRKINMASCIGKENAIDLCNKHIRDCKDVLEILALNTPKILAVLGYLQALLPSKPILSIFSKGDNVC